MREYAVSKNERRVAVSCTVRLSRMYNFDHQLKSERHCGFIIIAFEFVHKNSLLRIRRVFAASSFSLSCIFFLDKLVQVYVIQHVESVRPCSIAFREVEEVHM